MKTDHKNIKTFLTIGALLVLCASLLCLAQKRDDGPGQKIFATPEDAVVAMIEAVKSYDERLLESIFGPGVKDAVSSGDDVADRNGRNLFLAAYNERSVLEQEGDTMILVVGSEDWPFPIPLVKESAGWRFDTRSGVEELHYRRIGRNELTAISACHEYVAAQKEYAMNGHDGKPGGMYAQKFYSDPGKRNGLYWPVGEDEAESPLGEFFAEASAEGYTPSVTGKARPFHGYYFRILKAGRDGSFMIDDDMRKGFGLVAYPSEYNSSGIMTFLVDQNGIVYEKDLGEDTAKIAGQMQACNPDSDWQTAD